MTHQVETATVVGTITGTGTATLIVTASGMTNSPKTLTPTVTVGQTPAISSLVMRAALAADADVGAFFLVGGDGTSTITLTAREAADNDTTMNLSIDNGGCTGLTAAPTSANTSAGASEITNGYCTLAQIKADDRLNIDDTASDTVLCAVITAISRAIDDHCGRFFYKSAAHEVKYFTALERERVFVGDLVSITQLDTDNESGDRTYPYTWVATDYDLWPYNADDTGEPYRFIDAAPQGSKTFPAMLAKGVKLDGIFGWPAVPPAVREACLLWSERMFKRFVTPLGISAMTALGEMTQKVPPPDPDVMFLLRKYRMGAI